METEQELSGETEAPTVEQKLQEVEESPIVPDWVTYQKDKSYGVTLRLPHDCSVSATLNYQPDGDAQAVIDMVTVNDELRGKNIGTRLLGSLADEVRQYGATSLYGHVTSEGALKTRAKLFGAENLRFFNFTTGSPLELSYEEALASERINFGVLNPIPEELPEN